MLKQISDSQINGQFVNNSLFSGVYNKADLKELGQKAYVFNIDERTGPGTHWTCVINTEPNYVFYCDSFGQPPPIHVETLLKKTNKRIIVNHKQLQDLSAQSCGWWCIFIIKQIIHGLNPNRVLDYFTANTQDNERKLEKYFSINKLQYL